MASGVGIFFAVLIILLIVGGGGWIAYTRIRARRLGLPPPPLNPFSRNRSGGGGGGGGGYPSPAPSGVVGWFNDKVAAFKNRKYTSGAGYETSGGGGAGARGRARSHTPLDPDEAWDTRVGNEADVYGPGGYYEEQELGLHEPAAYSGSGYGAQSSVHVGVGGERGRSRQRELDERYDEEMGGGHHQSRLDPFGDNAEPSNISLRGVSPRPIDTSVGRHQNNGSLSSQHNSPTERRSMFRENV